MNCFQRLCRNHSSDNNFHPKIIIFIERQRVVPPVCRLENLIIFQTDGNMQLRHRIA